MKHPIRSLSFVVLGAAVMAGLAACGASAGTQDASNPGAVVPEPPVVESEPIEITAASAEITTGSQLTLSWRVTGAQEVRWYTITDEGDRDPLTGVLTGAQGAVQVPIPSADRLNLELEAHHEADDSSITQAVPWATEHVVIRGDDYDPYDVERTPSDPVPGTLRDVLMRAEPGAIIGFAGNVTQVDLTGVDLRTPSAPMTPGGPLDKVDAHLWFDRDVTVSGPTGRTVRLLSANEDASFASRIGYIAQGATVTLENLDLVGGRFIYSGAGLANVGTLTLNNVNLTDHHAWQCGGALYNAGILTIQGGVLDGNRAGTDAATIGVPQTLRGTTYETTPSDTGYGSAVCNVLGGTVDATGVTIRNHEAKYRGAIFNVSGNVIWRDGTIEGSTVTMTPFNLTEADATDDRAGGAIYNLDELTLARTTVELNESSEYAGGLYLGPASSATLDGVTLQANNAAAFDGNLLREVNSGVGPGQLTVTGGTQIGSTAPDLDSFVVDLTPPSPLGLTTQATSGAAANAYWTASYRD